MRDEQLFIDGELVDMDEDTNITLNIRSNLFTDLSKIVSNNSYTIKLPKTVRNQRIIEHADLPSCETDYPRKFHQGRYFRNGIEIVPDAKVALISVSDTIEMAMTWGNITVLQGIVENDKSLNELEDDDYHIIWEKAISDYEDADPFIVSRMNLGIRNYDEVNYVHPSVRVPWLLERIAADNDLEFSFPNQDVKDFIDRLIVPLLTRNGASYENYATTLSVSYDNGEVHGYNLSGFYRGDYSNEMWQMVEKDSNDGYYDLYKGMKMLRPNIQLRVSGTFDFTYANPGVDSPRFVMYRVKDDVVEEVLGADCLNVVKNSETSYHVYFDFEEESIALNADDVIYIAFSNCGWVTSSSTGFHIGLTPYVEEVVPKGVNGSDGYYPIISNLPDIKQVDFLKSIAYMTGTFACVTNNVLTFVSVDDLIANKSMAMDWTKKVVATFKDNKPNNITYTLDDFAQHNNYKWKEEDGLRGNYDYYLSVENTTLDYERDVVTMPFAATDTMLGEAYIPMYEYNGEETVGTLSSVEPRILMEYDNAGKSKAMFADLAWDNLIETFYKSYQQLIRKPVIITEKIEISDIELREIDVTVPVYLAQYGRYYAIISIKAENTGICECKLLQMEV